MDVGYPNLEASTYKARFSSGLLEVFIGIALAGMGAIWLTDAAGLGGVVPAALVPLYLPFHNRFIEPRTGYIRVAPERARRERASMVRLVVLGVGFFALGVGTFLWTVARDGDLGLADTFIAGLPAFLLAFGAVVAALSFGLPRLHASGAAVAIGGLAVVTADLHPGFGMLLPGLVVLAAGAVILVRFFGATSSA